MNNKAEASAMKQDINRELTPTLRFPEFRDAPGWSSYSGDKLFDAVNNRATAAGLPILAITQEHGAIPREQIDYHISVTDKSIESYKVVEAGDFIISLRSFEGGIEYSQYHGVCSPAYVILRRKVEGSDHFFKQLFKSQRFIQQLTRNVEGLRDGKMISYKQFSEQLLAAPDPDEQQKIADCLSSLDEVIVGQVRKVEKLKAYKKGLMQQLFPRQGETLPRLRFPEFQDAREWEWIPLGELLSRKPEYGINAPAVAYSEDLPTYLRITDITDEGRFINGTKVSVDINTENEHYLAEGDIVLARTGASAGKSYRYRSEDGKLVFAGFLIRVRPNPKKLKPEFLSSFLSSVQYWNWVRIASSRSGQPGINGSEYATLRVPIPPNDVADDGLSEQQRIANCLSSLDDIVAAQSQKLDGLKTHKYGLVQQLFPSPQEDEA